MRKDANVGIGLIASHPVSMEDLNAMTEPERMQAIAEAEDAVKACGFACSSTQTIPSEHY